MLELQWRLFACVSRIETSPRIGGRPHRRYRRSEGDPLAVIDVIDPG
jgi:hypothetical protein